MFPKLLSPVRGGTARRSFVWALGLPISIRTRRRSSRRAILSLPPSSSAIEHPRCRVLLRDSGPNAILDLWETKINEIDMLNSKAVDMENRWGNLTPVALIAASGVANRVKPLRLAGDFKIGGGEMDSAISIRM